MPASGTREGSILTEGDGDEDQADTSATFLGLLG